MFDHNSEPHGAFDGLSVSADFVGELLQGARMTGIEYRRIQISPPFGVAFGAVSGRAQFHFVAQGRAYLRKPDGEIFELRPGDAVLLPRGGRHDLVSSPDLATCDVEDLRATTLCRGVVAVNACSGEMCGSGDTVTFSGCMELDLGVMHPLVAMMPETMRVGTLLERYPEILPMLEAMARETQSERIGFAGILGRLSEVVSAFVVRAWIECGCGDAGGWVEALRDPRLGRVMLAIHRDPGRDWTVAGLASEMGSSRSVFAERFLSVTGMTPLRYLTEVRMRLAAQWIARGHMTIEAAAHCLGYGSQAAFSRAFKRVTGVPPGAVRADRGARGGPGPGNVRFDGTP